nr:integrase, catalytic region, zinc finger, CCHC-type, peptidase aspartic, catalytic [Tanacetum cinerariifolium]
INAGLDIFLECLNEEMVVDLRYFNSLEPEVDSLTSQLETQRTQFVNDIDRLSREYYYADHMHAIFGVYTELDKVTNMQCDYLELLKKCEGLETELSKSKMMSKSFKSVQKHAINLELELQQCKEKIKNDMSFKKGKSVDTKFEKSSVSRQPNAFKSQRPSVLGKLTTFSNSFVRKDFSKSTSVTQTHVSNDFSKPVTEQILPANKKSIFKNTNVLNPGMYKLHTDHTQTGTSQLHQDFRKTNKRVTFSTGVIPSTSVSRPQLKSNPMEDRVLRNNSRGKKQEVEDHRRNVKLPKNKTFVTACNDSLNAKTLNVVAKPIKRTVATESNKKPRNFTRKIYEHGGITIKRVYYVEGLNHSLFSIGQLCDADLEVAFRKSTGFIRDLKGNDLLSASISGKRYVLVIVDDYSRYTWTCFLRSKDETPEVLIDFLRLIQRGLQAQVREVRTDKGMEFLNQALHAYYAVEGIQHQTSVARTPEQNGVVERRNQYLTREQE